MKGSVRCSVAGVAAAGTLSLTALAACTAPPPTPQPQLTSTLPTTSAASTTTSATPTTNTASTTPTTATTPTAGATATPVPFDGTAAMTHVERLAAIGPRDSVSPGYATAAREVAQWLRATGHHVTLQPFRVPAGTSWGVRVPAGESTNIVADPPGFDPTQPHVVIGAHLDTVPQAPGAEDNASGVSTVVELARMLSLSPARVPVRLVIFGAEEARGSGWRWYAFGSRAFVDSLSATERRAIRAMVALDRVGVRTATVPVCHGGQGTTAAADAVRRAAAIPTDTCINRGSDHVSFERAGIAAARIGSVPYAAYHSSHDVPGVVDAAQLGRSAAVVWSWLRSLS